MSALKARDEGAALTETEGRRATAADDAATAVQTQTAETLKGLFGRDSLYMLLWAVQLGIAALCTPIVTAY